MDKAAQKRSEFKKEVNRVMIDLKTHKYVIDLYNEQFDLVDEMILKQKK